MKLDGALPTQQNLRMRDIFLIILAVSFEFSSGEYCCLLPWSPWSSCSVSCGVGGQQRRVQAHCCPEIHSYDCLENCEDYPTNTHSIDYIHDESRSCGDTCLHGGSLKPSGSGCQCLNRSFGHCCEELLPGCTPFPTDVIFVLDSSASQSKEQFKVQLDFVLKFVEHVNISKEEFQIAVITYSTEAAVEIEFDQSTDKDTLKYLIEKIEFRPGATFTDKGLKAAMEVARESERRQGMVSLTYAFVLTDGMSNNRKKTRIAAKRLRNANVHVIALGIGKEVSHQELVDIASPGDSFSPSYVFSVGDFNALDTLLKQLVQLTCDDCSATSHLSDIVFLLDESNDMSETEFQISLDVLSFIIDNTDHIGEQDGPVFGLVRLGKTINTAVEQSSSHLKNTLMAQIQALYRKERNVCDVSDVDDKCSETNITSAIDHILKNFDNMNGRENARQFLVVLSIGKFENADIVKDEMAAINMESDVRLFVIGPGLDVNMDGLLSLVKEANHVYVAVDKHDTSKLSIMQSEFSYNFCVKN